MAKTNGTEPTVFPRLMSLRALYVIWLPVAAVTILHYSTHGAHHWLHDIFRRLYYIPIILGAFHWGLRGGLVAALATSVVYFPHAFTQFFEQDPAATTEKLLEILLYNAVGAITGILASRERRERLRQEAVAVELQKTLDEKKILENQLVRAGKLKALGELTAGIAHEIKNPLASITGASEVIADEIPEASPKRKLVDIQKRELERLSGILERFLSFARPSELMLSNFELDSLIEDVIRLAKPQARKKRIDIFFRKNPPKIFFNGDQDRLTQVILNLVINAIDAVGEDGRIVVRLRRNSIGHTLYRVIDVMDDGPGIPRTSAERVFDPFFSTKESGSGLGLSISQKIVEGHGGFIEVGEAAREFNTVFSVYLP